MVAFIGLIYLYEKVANLNIFVIKELTHVQQYTWKKRPGTHDKVGHLLVNFIWSNNRMIT